MTHQKHACTLCRDCEDEFKDFLARLTVTIVVVSWVTGFLFGHFVIAAR